MEKLITELQEDLNYTVEELKRLSGGNEELLELLLAKMSSVIVATVVQMEVILEKKGAENMEALEEAICMDLYVIADTEG